MRVAFPHIMSTCKYHALAVVHYARSPLIFAQVPLRLMELGFFTQGRKCKRVATAAEARPRRRPLQAALVAFMITQRIV